MIKNSNKYKIWTDSGWQKFKGIEKLPKQPIIEIILEDNNKIKCTKDHKIYINLFECIEAQKLSVNDWVCTDDGMKKIISINELGEEDVYDIIDVENGNKFYSNNILVHNCEFIGKSNSLIDASILRQKILEIDEKKITYKFVVDNDIRFYQDINPWLKYCISIDTSMGVSGDFSAIQVFAFPGFYQVAEWQSDRLNQNEQVDKVKRLIDWLYKEIKKKGNKHPEIYWSLENNSSAEGFICALRCLEYDKNNYMKYGKLITENDNKRIGFTTTNRTKSMACSQLKILFESNRFHIYSREYLIQLSNFAAKSATSTSASAKGDGHDDLITSSLIIILMYLQCKNTYDLDLEIMPTNSYNDDEYVEDMAFLFNTRII